MSRSVTHPCAEEMVQIGLPSVTPARGTAAARRLSVLWIAEDDLSFHGLPVLLRHVPAVREIIVRRSTDIPDDGWQNVVDVCVGPPYSVIPAARHGSAPERRLTTVIALMDESDTAAAWAHAEQADDCLLTRDVTVAGLQSLFDRVLAGTVNPRRSAGSPVSATPRVDAGASLRLRLTDRERAVLRLLVQGHGNQQIASSLRISIHGAKRHISNLLIKFGCGNRTELAMAALAHGLDE